MDKDTRITRETFIYILTFILALLLRLTLLGRSALIESEAAWAVQAWQIHLGENISVGSQVGYLSFTEMLFSLFGGSDFLARFWPALVGSLIIWVPFQLRKELKQVPALVLAVGLAFDPALASVSRIAAGPIPALVFVIMSAAAFHGRKWSWLAITFGLGLLSGPAFWLGSLMLLITGIVCSLLGIFDLGQYAQNRIGLLRNDNGKLADPLKTFLIPAAVFVLISSFFLRNVQGLSAWTGALPEFIANLFEYAGFPALRLFINLLVSNVLILTFGVSGFIISWRKDDRVGKVASIWFVISLLVLLIIPGRSAVDLIWLVFPLWVSTASVLFRIYQLAKNFWVVYAVASLVGVLIVLNWLTFTGMVFQSGNSKAVLLQWGLIAASLALVILSITIAASEWGWPVSLKGLGLGTAALLTIFMLSAMVQGVYLRQGDPRSLWSDGRGKGQIGLLQDSIYDVSISQTGRGDSIQGTVIGSWDSLRWALRDLDGFDFQDTLDSEILPPVIITSELEEYLVDHEVYRGQDFVLETRPGWDGIIPADWISWMAFRSGPIEKEDIILWIRNDIYSGY